MITPQHLANAFRAAAAALEQEIQPPAPLVATTGQLQTLASPPPPPAATTGITADMITTMIMPHIANQQIKDALGVAMRELGVNNLPEAQPHQYGPLYTSFQAVLARFGIGGAPANPAPAGASII